MTTPTRQNQADTAAWHVIPFPASFGAEVCAWRYPSPYDVYSWPSWDELNRRGDEFADPQLRAAQYVAVADSSGALTGYGQLFPLADESGAPVIRLGLGLRPELCGGGHGAKLTTLLAAEAQRRAPGCTVDLEVLTWNERAIRAYRKAGFAIADAYTRDTPAGPAAFYCMVLARD
jgi:ribosomal protein S18 acetylase RimI-like enzyme